MESESWLDWYLSPISLGAEDQDMPKQQLYKDISELRIMPDEGSSGHENRNQFTFTNRNLDIIQNLHEAYLEYTLAIVSDDGKAYHDGPTATKYKAAVDELITTGATSVYAKVLPQTAFWIDGYTFELNDTTVSTQNSGLAKSLNVLNHGVYSKESRQLDYIGMNRDFENSDSPFKIQADKLVLKQMRAKIPLKYMIPYLSANKISWGVKTSLKITKLSYAEMVKLFNLPDGADDAWDGTATGTGIRISNIELVVPYVKLENNKQLSLWNQMYSNVNNRYWLENDYFSSTTFDNTINHTNEIYRIATKGLNSRPRWLLLSAIDPNDDAVSPMGFVPKTGSTYDGTSNDLKFTKIRVKINGIYIDGGDVLEFDNEKATSSYLTMPFATYGGDYALAYENYCKFFGLYQSKRTSPLSFNEWLQSQVFCFDLVNIDAENIFANSGNALIVEVEFSTVGGSVTATPTPQFKLVANILYDKQLAITHSNNTAVLTLT